MRAYLVFAFLVNFASSASCERTPFFVTKAAPVSIAVSEFMEAGAVAEDCSDIACDSASRFRTSSSSDCGIICSKIDACDWWSTEQILVSLHVNKTICSLFNTNGSLSVEGQASPNTTTGHRSCSNSSWPICEEMDTFVSGAGYSELWINAEALLKMAKGDPFCHDRNCEFTDSFRVESRSECAQTCSRLHACEHWSVTPEDNGLKCWLRREFFQKKIINGAVSGNRTCAYHVPYFNTFP